MVFQAEKITNNRPFKDVIIHGLIRDKNGLKMSKSLGNGIDPMDMIEEYGADSLRYYLCTDCALGTDLRFDVDKVKSTWNFINKLWNASRFVLMNIEDLKELNFDDLSETDKWILTKYEKIVESTTKHMDNYEFNLVGAELYNFIWEDFCSNYIEFSKFRSDNQTTKSTLCYVLTGILKMMHPFMPFVTEEIYNMLPIKTHESIMISDYPKVNNQNIFNKETEKIDYLIDFIRMFRNVKLENNLPKDIKVKINNNEDYTLISKLLKLENFITEEENITKYNVSNSLYNIDIFYEKQVTEEELKLKEKQIESLKQSIERRKKLLSNENYVAKVQ